MDYKRIVIFMVTLCLTFGVIGLSTPEIISNLRLGLDLKGGFEILYEAHPLEPHGQITREALRQTARSLEKRADAFGVSEPEVRPEGETRIRVRIAGITNQTELREIIKKPAVLSFRGPDGTKEMVGSDFEEGAAKVGFDELNQPVIFIQVKDKEKLRLVSQKLYQQPLSIYLDDRLLSSPIVRSVLSDGKATISGAYTVNEARELADVINLGALPLQLNEIYTQSVGASLGLKSLEQTLNAGLIGSILILLYMLLVYRIPGLIACITLIVYTWLLLFVFYIMNATLTLPGIAAFILGIGMAVDANIITAERIKEEVKSGKTLLSSLKVGSRHSLRTIMDANVTTILAGIVLYFIGTGAIRGFSTMLIMSILLSMVTNVLLSRFLLHLLIRGNWIKKPSWVGVKDSHIKDIHETKHLYSYRFDFLKYRKISFLLSSAIIVLGLIVMLIFNLNYGVDFKAGTSLDIVLGQSITQEHAEHIFNVAGYKPATLTVGGEQQDRISARFDNLLNSDLNEVNQIIDAFKPQFGNSITYEENTVDPMMALELRNLAIWSVLLACMGIMIYVSIRFEWKFALASVIGTLHCGLIVISLFSILQLEIHLPFVAAMLTIIGYSINDTIVIFDRIRENVVETKIKEKLHLIDLVNGSVTQTLTRTIHTGICVLLASLCLLIFGNATIQLFAFAMTLGLISGMYSSIFIAVPIWYLLKKKELSSPRKEVKAVI